MFLVCFLLLIPSAFNHRYFEHIDFKLTGEQSTDVSSKSGDVAFGLLAIGEGFLCLAMAQLSISWLNVAASVDIFDPKGNNRGIINIYKRLIRMMIPIFLLLTVILTSLEYFAVLIFISPVVIMLQMILFIFARYKFLRVLSKFLIIKQNHTASMLLIIKESSLLTIVFGVGTIISFLAYILSLEPLDRTLAPGSFNFAMVSRDCILFFALAIITGNCWFIHFILNSWISKRTAALTNSKKTHQKMLSMTTTHIHMKNSEI